MAEKQKIKALWVNNGDWYMVGIAISGNEVTEIVNLSQEYEDHTEFIYQVKIGDKVLADVINFPVTVQYEIN
jgi:hypothetical protein